MKELLHIWKKFSILILFIGLNATTVFGSTYYLTTAGVGTAQTAGNWNTGGVGGGGSAASNFTTNGDVFIISNGQSAIATASWTIAAGVTLQIESTGTLALTSGTGTLNFNIDGTLTCNGTTAYQVNTNMSGGFVANVNINATGTLITSNTTGFKGANCVLPVDKTGGSSTMRILTTFNATASFGLNGGTQASLGLPASFKNFTISGTGSKSFASDLTLSGTLTIGGSATLSFGTTARIVTISSTGNINNSGTIDMSGGNAAHYLKIAPSSVTALGGLTNGTGNFVEYTVLTGGQTIATASYGKLLLDNTSGTNTASSNFSVSNTMTTTSGGNLSISCGVTITITGTLTNAGTITGPTTLGYFSRIVNSNAITNTGSFGASSSYIACSSTISGGTVGSNVLQSSSQTPSCVVADPTPTLTAAGSATVDAAFNVTFTDDATWRAAITTIKIDGSTLNPVAYSISAGTITFTPSASALLQVAGSKTILVIAPRYADGSVSQTISVGAANKLAINTQPNAVPIGGGAFSTQPIVIIQDQYGNTVSSSASVTATIGAGSWTLGGTTSVSASAGTATFTNLTATNPSTSVYSATITFTSSGLTSVTSNTFNILYGTVYYLKTANLTAAQTASSWNTGGPGGGGSNAANFTTASTIFIVSSGQSASCGGALAIGAGVTLVNEGTLNMGTNQLTGAGVILNTGTFQTANTVNPPVPNGNTWGGTFQYSSTGSISGGTYNNLSFLHSTGTRTAVGNITVNGTLTTTTGGTLAMSTYTLASNVSTINSIISTSNTSSTPLPSGCTWNALVTYNGATTYIVGGTYASLAVNASTTSAIATGNIYGATSLTNNFDLLNMGIYQLAITGGFTNNNVVRTACTANPPLPNGNTWGGTVYYDNATGYLSYGTYGTLILTDASGTLQVSGGNLSVNILQMPITGVIDMGTNLITTLNDVTAMYGTIRTANTSTTPMPTGRTGANAWAIGSTIEYYGSTKQYIPDVINFYNFMVSNTAGVDVTVKLCINRGTLTINPGAILTLSFGAASTTSYWICYGNVTNNGTIVTPPSTPVNKDYDNRIKILNDASGTNPHLIGGNGQYGTTMVYSTTTGTKAIITGNINVTGRLWAHNATFEIGNADNQNLTITADSVFITSEASGSGYITVGAFTNTHTINTKNLSMGVDGTTQLDLYNSPTQVCNVNITIADNAGERIFTGSSHQFNDLTITNAYSLKKYNMWERPSTISTTIYGNLTLGTNTEITINANHLDVRGNIVNNGRLEATTGIVKLQNTAPSTAVHSVSGSGYFKHVTLNDSYGATLAGDITIDGDFILTSGIFTTTPSYSITLGTSATISEATPNILAPTSYVTGAVKTTRVLMQNVNNTFGGLGLEITEANLTNNSTLVIRTTGTSAFTGSVKRKFTITPTTDVGLNGTLIFKYFDNEIVGTETSYKLYKYVSSWTEQAGSTIDAANNKLTLTGITDFSDWTPSPSPASLPIELIQLTAKSAFGGVLISWETASEENNDYFTILRSNDGVNFTPIAQIQGAGTSSTNNNYSYFDESIYYGTTYYKLAQTDYDGTTTYSQIVSTQPSNSNFEIIKYINEIPSHCKFELLFSDDEISNEITISNMLGAVVYQEVIDKTPHEFIDIELQPGVYIISNKTGNSIYKQRFVVK